MKINTISPDSAEFLQILEAIAKPPEILRYIGILPQQRRPTVAIVGTRKPTAYGKEVTTRLAQELALKGVAIVSGLALGVDALAHRATLEAGGTTIAVLGNGLPRIYPASHQALAQQIVESGGAILSEYEKNEAARPHYFLERNRLVAGLADAVIITEAAARSGTLNTAMHAMEQGKEIFVVPGNITSPMSIGCNQLIKQGATPLIHSDEVLQVIAPELLNAPSHTHIAVQDPLQAAILKHITDGMRDGDTLQQIIGCSATDLSTALTMLEIAGAIRSLGANQWTLR